MARDMSASLTADVVAAGGIVSKVHSAACVVVFSSFEELSLAVRGAALGDVSFATEFAAGAAEYLEIYASTAGISLAEVKHLMELAARTKLLADWAAKATRKNKNEVLPLPCAAVRKSRSLRSWSLSGWVNASPNWRRARHRPQPLIEKFFAEARSVLSASLVSERNPNQSSFVLSRNETTQKPEQRCCAAA